MLVAIPLTLDQAARYVAAHHRHHRPPRGHRFSIGCVSGHRLAGVAIAGRPVARRIEQYRTLEVLRMCTDGTPNACSFLYGAMRRAAFAMGYERILTYTLPEEGGASLRAAGWRLVRETAGGAWHREIRDRRAGDSRRPLGAKHQYIAENPRAHAPLTIDWGIPLAPEEPPDLFTK